MPLVRFAKRPELLFLRSVACPNARWCPDDQSYQLSHVEAAAFLVALRRRVDRRLTSVSVEIDGQMFEQRAYADLRASAD